MPHAIPYFHDVADLPVAEQRLQIEALDRDLQSKGYTLRMDKALIENEEYDYSSMRLECRPEGGVLRHVLQRGDALVVARLSLLARDLDDLTSTLLSFQFMGFALFVRDVGRGETDISKWEPLVRDLSRFISDRNSERGRQAAETKRERGKPLNQHVPPGYKLIGHRRSRRVVPDAKEQKIIHRIVKLHDEKRLSFERIHLRLLEERVRTRFGTEWSLNRICTAYRNATKPASKAQPKEEEATA